MYIEKSNEHEKKKTNCFKKKVNHRKKRKNYKLYSSKKKREKKTGKGGCQWPVDRSGRCPGKRGNVERREVNISE